MIISTFNIQNNSKDYNSNKAVEIYNYLINNKIDILGLQEVFYKCNNDLEKLINSKYNIIGKYRYFLKFLYPNKNEKNPIITKYNIINSKTYHLPSFKGSYNRIITKSSINYKGNNISVYNTHIEVINDEVKSKQLEYIYNLIRNENNLIILMGDFNFKKSNKIFDDFINKLKSINIKLVDINTNTFKTSKDNLSIDHIFVSNVFKITKKKVIKDMDISDHYPVMVEIEL